MTNHWLPDESHETAAEKRKYAMRGQKSAHLFEQEAKEEERRRRECNQFLHFLRTLLDLSDLVQVEEASSFRKKVLFSENQKKKEIQE